MLYVCLRRAGWLCVDCVLTGAWLGRYADNQGFAPCRTHPGTCAFDPSFYSDYLKQPLGKPLGVRKAAGDYRWTREFEHATVTLDLKSPLQGTSIVFHKTSPAAAAV